MADSLCSRNAPKSLMAARAFPIRNIRLALAALLATAASGVAFAEESRASGDPSSATVAASSTPSVTSTEAARGSSRRLPFLAEEARKRGIELPLPFGAALVLTGLGGRDIEVTDVRLGVDGNVASPATQLVDLGSTSNVFNAN